MTEYNSWPQGLTYFKKEQPTRPSSGTYPMFSITREDKPYELQPFNELCDLLRSKPTLGDIYCTTISELPFELVQQIKKGEPMIIGWIAAIIVQELCWQISAAYNDDLARAAGELFRQVVKASPMEIVLTLSVGDLLFRAMLEEVDKLRAAQVEIAVHYCPGKLVNSHLN